MFSVCVPVSVSENMLFWIKNILIMYYYGMVPIPYLSTYLHTYIHMYHVDVVLGVPVK